MTTTDESPVRFEEALLRTLEANAYMLFAVVILAALTPDEPATRRQRRKAPKRP
jgi:hypothetical protein